MAGGILVGSERGLAATQEAAKPRTHPFFSREGMVAGIFTALLRSRAQQEKALSMDLGEFRESASCNGNGKSGLEITHGRTKITCRYKSGGFSNIEIRSDGDHSKAMIVINGEGKTRKHVEKVGMDCLKNGKNGSDSEWFGFCVYSSSPFEGKGMIEIFLSK